MSLLPPLPPLPQKELLMPVLLRDLLAPAVVAGWILFRCAVRRRDWVNSLGSVVAVIAAVVVGNWGRDIFPWTPEEQTWQWIPVVALVVMLVGLLVNIPQLPWFDRWTLCAAASIWAAWKLTPLDLIENDSAGTLSATWAVWLFAVVIFVEWLLLDALAKALRGGAVSLGLAILLMATSMVVLYGTTRYTSMAMMLAAGLAGVSLVAWLFGVDVGATAPCALVFVGGLLLADKYYTDSKVTQVSFLLLALAPLGPIVLTPILFWPAAKGRLIVAQVLFVVLFCVPAITAVVLTVQNAGEWPF